MNLYALGWNAFFADHFQQLEDKNCLPARITIEQKDYYLAYGEEGEVKARLPGRFRHTAITRADLPVVGDWVAVKKQTGTTEVAVQAVLPRKSRFVRKAPISGGRKLGQVGGRETIIGGGTEEQVIAANIDVLALVSALDLNFNLRRIERFLTLAASSGTKPVLLLNKTDLCDDVELYRTQVRSIATGIPVHALSALQGSGLGVFEDYLSSGQTLAFIGSSGVGKSTLVNALLGEARQKVNAVSEHVGKGRHTTTYRELVIHPQGGIIIDTPGLRELQIWGEEDDVDEVFHEIEELIAQCRFGDCSHEKEPGCAVRQALLNGDLDAGRYESYCKQKSEMRYLAHKRKQKAKREGRRAKKGGLK